MPAPITSDDLYNFQWIDHVRLDPAGERVAYALSWANRDERENQSRIVIRGLAPEDEPVDATDGPYDSSPEWSPSGALAFLRRVNRRAQLFVRSADGAETRQLTDLPDGVGGFSWSPDGARLAFTARVLAEEDGVVDDPRPPESSDVSRRAPVARVVRRLDYKYDGRGYFDGRRTHLHVVDATGGPATQLTRGTWDAGDFSWAPDGERIAVTGNAAPDSDLSHESHVYTVTLDGDLQQLTSGKQIEAVEWSPDGRRVAFAAPLEIEGGRLERLWFADVAGGDPVCVTRDWDRSVADSVIDDMRAGHDVPLRWAADGGRIFFLTSTAGATALASVSKRGDVTELTYGRRRVYDFDVRDGRTVFLATDLNGPGDLYVDRDGQVVRLTDLNPWLRERYVAEPERFVVKASDGKDIETWLLTPPDFDPSAKYPLLLQVHGGPHAQYGWTFFHEFQVLAGLGFLVLYANPRGSDGYGEDFRGACVRDWGGADFQDLMAVVDEAVAREYVDGERLGILGGSYGGFMTNWAIGQTDRFRAAVSMRSIANLVSDYAQNDIVLWSGLEMGPPPWPDPEEQWRRSPIRYVQNVKTPLLLTHGEMDLRCPISQAEEMFGALRLLGKDVEMVRFPDESHDLSRSGRPDRRVERLDRVSGWMVKHLHRD
ncbi:MAG TPA: S9 family peptidase [Candidatus Dormibacteraeota bacterium]